MSEFDAGQELLGKVVLEEWKIVEAIDLTAKDSTGGHFSLPFKVQNINNGTPAFLKVIDVLSALRRYSNQGSTLAEGLREVTSSHVYEVELMEACAGCKRIVQAIGSGTVAIEVPIIGKIGYPFLVFEMADGDTHAFLQSYDSIDLAWWFRVLHQAAVGMSQLHRRRIAHQDIKPSNLLFFKLDDAKLADLGRAYRLGDNSKNDLRWGDWTYVAPEYYYGYSSADWNERYIALDLYMLGNLAFMGLTQVSITACLLKELPDEFNPLTKAYDFQDALPILHRSMAKIVEEIQPLLPPAIRAEFVTVILQLCNPDPSRRGHPMNHGMKFGDPYGLERYIAIFDRLSRKAAIGF